MRHPRNLAPSPDSRSAATGLLLLALAFGPLACGSEEAPIPGSPGPQPGATSAWQQVTERRICPGSGDCPGSDGFTVRADGRYLIGDREAGSLESGELTTLAQGANEVAALNLTGDPVCSPPGQNPPPAFAADGVTVTLRLASGQDHEVYANSTEGGECSLADLNQARALAATMSTLLVKYASGPAPSPSPSGSPDFCTQEYVYGVTVKVSDPQGNPVNNATATLTDGEYTETMRRLADNPNGVYSGAGERAGSYRLEISAPGFQTATEDGITVTQGECHVDGVRRDITLRP